MNQDIYYAVKVIIDKYDPLNKDRRNVDLATTIASALPDVDEIRKIIRKEYDCRITIHAKDASKAIYDQFLANLKKGEE